MAEVVFGEVRFLPPERIDFSQDAGHARVRLMDAGEITQLFPPGQKEVSFSGFFPAEADRYGGCSGAEEAAGKLREMMEGKKPYRFSLSGVEMEVTMMATLESLSLWQEAGDGSVFYSVKVREYRTAAAVSGITERSAGSKESKSPSSYTVVKGDTLWGIAKRFLGDGARYTEIAALSGIGNPNLIKVGQVVKLPTS